jgi:predicted RNase H-like HicB family nuclease
MSTIDPKHYSMIIQWDANGQIYIVRVPELPGCITHGKTYEEAIQQGQDAIEGWISSAIADNEPVPPPRLVAYEDVGVA